MKKKVCSIISMVAATALLLAGCTGVVTNEPAQQSQTQTSSAESTQGTAQNASESSSETQTETVQQTADPATAPATPLEGASIVLKVAHPDNDTNMLEQSWNCYARTFKNSVEIYSGGEITCEIYPNNQLGDGTSCMEQCSQGTLDVCMSLSTGSLAGWIPNISVFDIPYIVGNIDASNLLCEGPIYRELDTELREKGNLHILSMFQTGFRNLDTMSKRITSVDEMQGLKFRLQEIDAQIAMAEAWGSIPTTVSFSELYSAAQTGMIEAFDNANHILFLNNLYETVKYVTQTEHLANVVVALISEKTYSSLTPEQQQAVDRAAMDARRATLGVVAANNVSVTSRLQSNGIEIISLSDEEKQAFKDKCFDKSKSSVMEVVDESFYNRFMDAYNNAEETLGLK